MIVIAYVIVSIDKQKEKKERTYSTVNADPVLHRVPAAVL